MEAVSDRQDGGGDLADTLGSSVPDDPLAVTGVSGATQMLGSTVKHRNHIPAYYGNRNLPRTFQKACSTSEAHWCRNPCAAAEVQAADVMQFQALPQRSGPNPYEGAQRRWPHAGVNIGNGPHEPLDDRRHPHNFGYHEQRWKKPWCEAQARLFQRLYTDDVPRIDLADIKLFLTGKFGNLKAAYDHLDFFADGMLSLVEWQEGLGNLFRNTTSSDEKLSKYRVACEPKMIFNERMQAIFRKLDSNKDGLIDFEDLSRVHNGFAENPRTLKKRHIHENYAAKGDLEKKRLACNNTLPNLRLGLDETSLQIETADSADVTDGTDAAPASASDAPEANKEVTKASPLQEMMKDFASALLNKYPNIKAALKSFDDSGNSQLSMAEFCTGAKKMHFTGDLKAVFKELDLNRNGVIGAPEFKRLVRMARTSGFVNEGMIAKSKKEDVEAKKSRQGSHGPPPLTRGECLAGSSSWRPHSDKISSSAGFYTFPRTTTRRLDISAHPDDLPGVDHGNYAGERGPGYLQKGPEYYSSVGDVGHPTRGNRWKNGSTVNKSQRFGRLIPSKGVADDQECHNASFITYENHAPTPNHKVHGLGATSMAGKSQRVGKTFGTQESHGMVAPKPIGTWGETRMGVAMMSRSMPSLLHVNY